MISLAPSGHANGPEHFADAFKAGAEAALAATLFHYRELEIATVKRTCVASGLPMREVP